MKRMLCAHKQCRRPQFAYEPLCELHYRRLMEGRDIAAPISTARQCAADLAEDVAFLLDSGESWDRIPARVGKTSAEALLKVLRRWDFDAVADRFSALGKEKQKRAAIEGRARTKYIYKESRANHG